ncbi:MAG: hypothetical protein M3Y18_04470 [Candidatus Eremiobacteraeota bacterium]|nr:hypothetical protein [Candidatus Eremiobacteraeota bacterium]
MERASVRIDRVPRLCDGFIQKAVRIRRSGREVEHRNSNIPSTTVRAQRFGSSAAQKAALRSARRCGVDDGVEIGANRGDRRAQFVSDDGEKFVALAFDDASFQRQGDVFLEVRPSPGRHDRPPTLDRSACGRRHLGGHTRQSRPAVTRAGHTPRPRRGIHKRRKNVASGIMPDAIVVAQHAARSLRESGPDTPFEPVRGALPGAPRDTLEIGYAQSQERNTALHPNRIALG